MNGEPDTDLEDEIERLKQSLAEITDPTLNAEECQAMARDALGWGTPSRERDILVEQVGARLREECLSIFGRTWSYDVAWRLAKVAVDEMRRMDRGK